MDETTATAEPAAIAGTAVYFWDPDTGVYAGTMPAHADPITGHPLLPANATFLPPPPTADNQAAQHTAGHWSIIPDYRGGHRVEISTKRVSTVTELGPIAPGYQLVTDEQASSITQHPDYWLVEGGQVVPLDADARAHVDITRAMTTKRTQREALFATVDWLASRGDDQALLGIPATDQRAAVARYRQYLRDFTKRDSWWTRDMLTYEEFVLNELSELADAGPQTDNGETGDSGHE